MALYERKPVTIEAEVWTGDNEQTIRDFVKDKGIYNPYKNHWVIRGYSEKEIAEVGDYIVKEPGLGYCIEKSEVFKLRHKGVQ